MDRSDIKSRLTLSGSEFYQKIIQKYQRGKRKNLRFPLLNFYENRGYFLPKKISINLLFKLQLNNQNIVPFLTAKDTHDRKGKTLWPSSENTLLSRGKLKHNQSLNRIPAVTFLKSLVFRIGNTTIEPDIILKPLFLALNAASYEQTNYTTSSENLAINQQLLNYRNVQIPNSQMFGVRINRESLNAASITTLTGKDGKYKLRSTFEHKSPAVLSQYNLLFNSTTFSLNKPLFQRLFNIFWDRQNLPLIPLAIDYNQSKTQKIIKSLLFQNINKAANNLLIKNYYSSGNESFGFVQNGYAYQTASPSLRFWEPSRIETEIEQIKKIVIETKESVLEKPAPSLGETDIKRYFDINRISDQVYKNIERTIRMERERRGM